MVVGNPLRHRSSHEEGAGEGGWLVGWLVGISFQLPFRRSMKIHFNETVVFFYFLG